MQKNLRFSKPIGKKKALHIDTYALEAQPQIRRVLQGIVVLPGLNTKADRLKVGSSLASFWSKPFGDS